MTHKRKTVSRLMSNLTASKDQFYATTYYSNVADYEIEDLLSRAYDAGKRAAKREPKG